LRPKTNAAAAALERGKNPMVFRTFLRFDLE